MPKHWTLILIGRDVPIQGLDNLPCNGYRAVLERRCMELELSDNIKFLGERSDAPALLRCADIGVLPSHEEGFSNALLEMMAASLATVASDVGGNAEALDGGHAGLLVPPQDPDALAGAIRRLIDAPDTRKSFGDAARMRVLENYTIARCADAYEDVYTALLAASRR